MECDGLLEPIGMPLRRAILVSKVFHCAIGKLQRSFDVQMPKRPMVVPMQCCWGPKYRSLEGVRENIPSQ